MSKRSFRTALAVVIATVAVLGGFVLYFVSEALSYPDHRHKGTGAEVEVEIKQGMSFQQIAELLGDENVIDRPSWFRLYALHRGVANRVRSGRYILHDDWTPREVLDKLLEGVVEKQVKVTLEEGHHMLEYFDELEQAGVATRKDLEALARDREFLTAHGIE